MPGELGEELGLVWVFLEIGREITLLCRLCFIHHTAESWKPDLSVVLRTIELAMATGRLN